MHDLFSNLQDQLTPVLRRGDLKRCESTVAKHLASLPQSPFHCILDLSITNSPGQVAAHFDKFFRREGNGGHENHGWLADWQSQDYPDMTITGLEPLQQVYASDAFREDAYADACDMASLLVVIKFQDLIRRAAPGMQNLRCPLLATAHDYDFIFEVQRPAQ